MEQDNDTTMTTEEQPRRRSSGLSRVLISFRWPLVVIILALIGYLAYLKGCQTVKDTGEVSVETVREIGEAASTIAERFQTGTITTTFISAIPHLLPDGGTRLELAAFETVETFTRSDDKRVMFDLIPLGTTVTEIRVPATYRYHLRLDDPWQLMVRGHTCVVHAPAFLPTLPPAIDTGRMEKRSESGWLRFNEDDQMRDLERTITNSLNLRAANPDHMNLVREQCRVRVAEFVRTWLLREDHWRADRFSSIIVIFADEEMETGSLRPAVALEVPDGG